MSDTQTDGMEGVRAHEDSQACVVEESRCSQAKRTEGTVTRSQVDSSAPVMTGRTDHTPY